MEVHFQDGPFDRKSIATVPYWGYEPEYIRRPYYVWLLTSSHTDTTVYVIKHCFVIVWNAKPTSLFGLRIVALMSIRVDRNAGSVSKDTVS